MPDPETVRLEAQAAPAPDNSLRRDMTLRSDEGCVNGEIVRVDPRLGVLHEIHNGKPARCLERSRLP